MKTIKSRIQALITQLEEAQAQNRHLTETEKMEMTAELLSVAEQKIRQQGESHAE